MKKTIQLTENELYNIINKSVKKVINEGLGGQDLEKAYEDNGFAIYVPHTWEAARKIGGDTHWITSDKQYFDYYLNRYGGEYYCIIRKSDGAKFLLHSESCSLVDSNNSPVTFDSVCNDRNEYEVLKRFFESKGKNIGKLDNGCMNENKLNRLISKSVKKVINEGLGGQDIEKVRELYDMICKWQDSVQGYGMDGKLIKAWRYMDQTVRPYLDNIMYGYDDDSIY